MSNVSHLPNSLESDITKAFDASMSEVRAPILRAAKAVDATRSVTGEDRIETRIEAYRRDISAHEKAINRLQKEQAIREAELQSDLASLAQEIEERKAELQREADRRESEINSRIDANRNERTEEIKTRSRLLAASHASLDSLQGSKEPVMDFRSLAAAE